jgi:hypothetical protein
MMSAGEWLPFCNFEFFGPKANADPGVPVGDGTGLFCFWVARLRPGAEKLRRHPAPARGQMPRVETAMAVATLRRPPVARDGRR